MNKPQKNILNFFNPYVDEPNVGCYEGACYRRGYEDAVKQKQNFCRCGNAILADTEDWTVPMCHDCSIPFRELEDALCCYTWQNAEYDEDIMTDGSVAIIALRKFRGEK